MENLNALKADMKLRKWVIQSFQFIYKRETYIVLVHLFVGNNVRVNPLASVRLDFLRYSNINDIFQVEANRLRLFIDTRKEELEFRAYFRIDDSVPNSGKIKDQFAAVLGKAIPSSVNATPSDREKEAMARSLSLSDSRDPSMIYCKGVKRNPEENGIQQKRSLFNDNKTRILRPELYRQFENDKTISFVYSADSQKSKSDADILRDFSLRQG